MRMAKEPKEPKTAFADDPAKKLGFSRDSDSSDKHYSKKAKRSTVGKDEPKRIARPIAADSSGSDNKRRRGSNKMEIQRYNPDPSRKKAPVLKLNCKAKGLHRDSWKQPATPKDRPRGDSTSDEDEAPRVQVSLSNVILDDALVPEVTTAGHATPKGESSEGETGATSSSRPSRPLSQTRKSSIKIAGK